MTARRQTTPKDPPISTAPPADASQEALEDAISELGAAGGDAFVRVMKHDTGRDNKTGWGACGRIPAVGFDPFDVARTWGPGRYRFEFCKGGDTRHSYKTLQWVAVPTLAQRADAAGLTQLGERKPEPVDRPAPAGDREFLERMVLVLLESRQQPAGNNMTDLIAGLAALKDLTQADKPAPVPLDQLMDAIKTGSNLAGMAIGNGDGEGSMLERFAPQLLKLLDRGLSQPPAPAQLQAAPAPGAPPAVAAPPEDPVFQVVRHWAPAVIQEAAAGRDPVTWAYYIAERTPPAYIEVLHRIAFAPEHERRPLLLHVSPAIEPHLEWMEQACAGLREYLTPDEAPAGGNGTDVAAAPPAPPQEGQAGGEPATANDPGRG